MYKRQIPYHAFPETLPYIMLTLMNVMSIQRHQVVIMDNDILLFKDDYSIIYLMKKFVLVVEITIRMITVAHHYVKIIPISAFKLHSPSSDWNSYSTVIILKIITIHMILIIIQIRMYITQFIKFTQISVKMACHLERRQELSTHT